MMITLLMVSEEVKFLLKDKGSNLLVK